MPISDIVFNGVTSEPSMKITASKSDVNGRTEIYTPSRVAYTIGDTVTFTVEPLVENYVPNVLYGQMKETYTFVGWQENAVTIATDTSLEVLISGQSRELIVAYVKTPVSFIPGERQLYVMSSLLNQMLVADYPVSQEFVIFIGGDLVTLFGNSLFPSRDHAVASLRRCFNLCYPDWLNRLPQGLKDWALDDGQRDDFFSYWLNNSVTIVPYNQLSVTG